ncbi:MAG TPA: hypothetical protein VHP14_23740, partial [Anaerolineales bacterium]|nr:hypothetical protein [Anaerolineales bacterium]
MAEAQGALDKSYAKSIWFLHQVRVATSTLTLTECLTKPLRDQDAALVTAYQAMLRQTRGIALLPVNTTVAAR